MRRDLPEYLALVALFICGLAIGIRIGRALEQREIAQRHAHADHH